MSEGILLRFANEEMIYLLRSLHITNFPGFASEPLKELANEEKSLLMMEADHTLRARGLVYWRGETEREIDPLIARIFLACAQPRYTLFIDMLGACTTVAKLLYIFGRDIIVEQCSPEPQVLQYLVLPSRDHFTHRLRALVVPEQEKAAQMQPGGVLHREVWKGALKAAREHDEISLNTLLAGDLPASTAAALATALSAPSSIRYLGFWQQTPTGERDAPEAELTLVTGGDLLFLLWSDKANPFSLHVNSASAQQVPAYLNQLISPALV